MLFRRYKVNKVLKEYQKVFLTNTQGMEELEALRVIQLEELAIMYDLLDGIRYYRGGVLEEGLNAEHCVPDRSMKYPSFVVDMDAHLFVRKARAFNTRRKYPDQKFFHAINSIKLTERGNVCWKGH